MIQKIIASAIVWVPLFLLKNIGTYTILGFPINNAIGILASVLSIAFPKTFDMGVSDRKHASLLAKICPIIYCIGIVVLLRLTWNSITTLIINSSALGFIATYIGKLFGEKKEEEEKKKKSESRRKR